MSWSGWRYRHEAVLMCSSTKASKLFARILILNNVSIKDSFLSWQSTTRTAIFSSGQTGRALITHVLFNNAQVTKMYHLLTGMKIVQMCLKHVRSKPYGVYLNRKYKWTIGKSKTWMSPVAGSNRKQKNWMKKCCGAWLSAFEKSFGKCGEKDYIQFSRYRAMIYFSCSFKNNAPEHHTLISFMCTYYWHP